MKNILEYLKTAAAQFPDRVGFTDGTEDMTFAQVNGCAQSIGSFLLKQGIAHQPVAVFMKKGPRTVTAFFGAIYAGCYYACLDEEMPPYRIEAILAALKPAIVLCEEHTRALLQKYGISARTCLYDEAAAQEADPAQLDALDRRQIDTDPIYIVFTSGSTGVPKGIAACHRSVVDYVENLAPVLQCDGTSVFGNQTPLYFDACLKEIMLTLKYGAKTVFIPKKLFMFPVKLLEFLNEHEINTLCWVVSALTILSSTGAMEHTPPKYLRTIAFASEVFPMRQFHIWRNCLPNARFINLYGPTEATGVCCYYVVDREFADGEVLPVGRPFDNTGILLLDGDREAAPGEPGEICVRGTCLTLGYYNDPEKTRQVFVQNPLNPYYPERIYRTGDIGKYNDRGELVFLSRKDHQIKIMGHRVELGEIEVVANLHPEVREACCIYQDQRLKLYYVGSVSATALLGYLRGKLPRYMLPASLEALPALPRTPNGKINRPALMQDR